MSARKPHNEDAGYVCELRSKHPKLPGHFVIYDARVAGIDADHRWVVMHQPSTHLVSIKTLAEAREVMREMAKGGNIVDLGQYD